MAGRPQSMEGQEILKALASVREPEPAGLTAREVARRLQLSTDATAKRLSRLVERGQAKVSGVREVDGSARPVNVYRAVSVDAYPSGSIFEALNRAIALRRALRDL